MKYFLFLPRSQREFALYILRTTGSKSTSIKLAASMAGPGLNSEPQNRRITNRRISKDGIAALCLLNQ